MYMGASMDAMPIPIPPTRRATISPWAVCGNAAPIAEAKKSSAESKSIFFRPNRSLIVPAPMTPMIHPTSAELTTQPSMTASRVN